MVSRRLLSHLNPTGRALTIVHLRYPTLDPPGRATTDHERGATAVEYGLLVALIAAVIVAIVITLGLNANGLYQSVDWP